MTEVLSSATTQTVRALYTEFPYPPAFKGWRLRRREDKKLLKKGGRAGAALLSQDPGLDHGGRVLDVGTGTGHRSIGLALALPKTQVIGFELSPNSAAKARENAAQLKATHLEVREASFFDAELGTELFDAAHCSSVLHHLEDPEAGLAKLIAAVKPGGVFYLAVYGTHGREEVRRVQRAVALLEPDAAAFTERLNVLRGLRGMGDDPKLRNDSYAVDYFLHPREVHYEMKDLFAMFDRHGADLIHWTRFERSLKKWVPDQAVRERVMALDLPARYRFVELLSTPGSLHVVGRRRG